MPHLWHMVPPAAIVVVVSGAMIGVGMLRWRRIVEDIGGGKVLDEGAEYAKIEDKGFVHQGCIICFVRANDLRSVKMKIT